MNDILPVQQPTTSNPALTEESVPQPASAPEPEPNLATSPEIEPKNNGKWLWIATALIVVASLIVAGYFYYQNLQLKQQADLPQIQASISVPELELSLTQSDTDPTANWQIFTSNLGYSLKYPQGYSVSETGFSENDLQNAAGISIVKGDIADPLLAPRLTLQTQNVSGDIGEYMRDLMNRNINHPAGNSELLSDIETMTINGNEATQFVTRGSVVVAAGEEFSTEDSRHVFAGIEGGGKFFLFYYTDAEPINQILSTFEFADQNTTSFNNWNTYTDSINGFAFEYPEDWQVRNALLANSSIPTYENDVVFLGIVPEAMQEDFLASIRVIDADLQSVIDQVKFIPQGTPAKITSEKEISFLGIPATEIVRTNTSIGESGKTILFEKDDLIYMIGGWDVDGNPTLTQILSTFEFAN